MPYLCEPRHLQPQPALTVRREVPLGEAGPAIVEAFQTVGAYLKRSGVQPAGETFARFHRVGPDSLDVEVGFTVTRAHPAAAPIQSSELPGGDAVSTLHRGPYERVPEAVAALEAWMRDHGRRAAGPHWEVYLNGPPDVTDPALYETEVVVPLAS